MSIEFLSYQTGLEHAMALLYSAAFPDQKPWTAEVFKELLNLPACHVCVCYDEINGLQGFLVYSLLIDEAEIIVFAVDPVCQGQGIGKKIMTSFLRKMKQLHVHSVFLEVAETNHRAYALYDCHGFTVQTKRLNYYGKDNHALLMKHGLK